MASIAKNLSAFVAQSDSQLLTFTYDDNASSADVDLTAVTSYSWTSGTRVFVMVDDVNDYTLTVPEGHPLLDVPPFNNVGYATSMDRLVGLLVDLGVTAA